MSLPAASSEKTLAEWTGVLAHDPEAGPAAWQELRAALAMHHVRLADALWAHLDGEERIGVLRDLLSLVCRCARRDLRTRRVLFDQAESMGVHFLPVHFYSPVPEIGNLGAHVWTARWDEGPGFDWHFDDQLALLERLRVWARELEGTPTAKPSSEGQYYFENGAFGAPDAIVYYAMIREFRPRTVLEVGGGYSTLIAAQASLRNGDTRVRVIEPYPSAVLTRGFPGLSALLPRRLQEVDPAEFEALASGDILFVDSTHVCKIDSDVNHLVLRILPRLAPGVLVHFHDIHLPRDYGKGLVLRHKRFWSEQYLLLAFLLFNKAFHVVWGSRYMGHSAADALRAAFPFAPKLMGSSLWIKKDG